MSQDRRCESSNWKPSPDAIYSRFSAFVHVIGLHRRIKLLYQHSGDAISIHLGDREAAATIVYRIFNLRNIPELEEQKSRQSFKSRFSGQHKAIASFQIADGCATFELQNFLLNRGSGSNDIMLIADIAEDLLEDIPQSDQACYRSELIHYEGHVGVIGAKFIN